MNHVNILGIRIACDTFREIISQIETTLLNENRENRYSCATSVHGVIEAQFDTELRDILNHAFINHPDGLPLVRVGRWRGAKHMEQIKGPDLFPKVCELTSKMNVKHFFCGGQEGVADDLARRMSERFPGLKVAGTYCPPFRALSDQEKDALVETINASGADIVWVGLSTPKQEKWIGEFRDRLNTKLIFSVGAAFDYHTGRIKFSPVFFQRLGLEWFHRLISEPRRLWRRYLKIVPLFIIYSSLQLTGLKTYDIGDDRK